MTPTLNQRWRARRDSYRPAGEVIRTADYEVAAIPDDTTAKRFVVEHHYAGTFPAARFRFGLYRGAQLVGVAVFSQPCNDAVCGSVFPGERLESSELGRFVLLDDVPGNGESWFLARCFEDLRREEQLGVVSFSDDTARTDAAGRVVFLGHFGTIYQAANGVFLGRGTARTLRLLPDGRAVSARALQKIRKLERGWRYAVEQLVAHGAAPLTGEPRAWLAEQLPRVTRTVRHPGCLKYAWGLSRSVRRHLPASAPYPKRRAA